jgi:alkanesulfonate monooxygenase SsuD/methylene tetrahydromethanopterin reductase-like flavin-dependent oxidoreductase (luciferase family)
VAAVEIGVGFTPFETRRDVVVSVARLADDLGLAGVGLAEASGHASPILMAEIALATQRVELSCAVLSVWSRTPAVMAMTAAGLQRLSDGRFVLGIGASTPPLVEGLHGLAWREPYERLQAVLEDVRSLLAGRRLPSAPQGSRALRLQEPPAVPVPLGVATMSPRGIRLAGQLADRWLPFLWPRSRLDVGRRLLADGAAAAGRDAVPAVCPVVPLAVGRDEISRSRIAARWLLTYCTRMGPMYPRMLRDRFGFTAEVDALLAANQDQDEPVLPAAAHRLADDVLIMASAHDLPDAVAQWTLAGADRVDLALPFAVPQADVEAMVAAVAAGTGVGPRVPGSSAHRGDG